MIESYNHTLINAEGKCRIMLPYTSTGYQTRVSHRSHPHSYSNSKARDYAYPHASPPSRDPG